ncbi:hypothetical protein IC582_024997 [Cucumis melo]
MGGRNQPRSRISKKPFIRQVWASNFISQITQFDECLRFHTILTIDTEFLGFIIQSPRDSIDEEIYKNFHFNVNQMKLIQLGITASNDLGQIGGSWEFNFSDFDFQVDAHSPSAIPFLEKNGLDFKKLKKDGIPIASFTKKFLPIIKKRDIFRWVTFHGLYDIGYLIKAMGLITMLPKSMEEFATLVVNEVGIVRDLKHMARFCEVLEDGRLGLERLGKILNKKRFGMKHNAGSDSLLTSSAHFEMVKRFGMTYEVCNGFLYGFSESLESMKMKMKIYHQNILRLGQIPHFPYTPSCIISH